MKEMVRVHVHKAGQRRDVQANIAIVSRVPQSHLSQRYDVEAQRRDVLEC